MKSLEVLGQKNQADNTVKRIPTNLLKLHWQNNDPAPPAWRTTEDLLSSHLTSVPAHLCSLSYSLYVCWSLEQVTIWMGDCLGLFLSWFWLERVSVSVLVLAWFGMVQYLGWDAVQQVVERAKLSQGRRRGRLGRHGPAKWTRLVLKITSILPFKNT